MKHLKKFMFVLVFLFTLVLVASCGEEKKTDTEPVINGAVDKEIEKNSKFAALEGITATDAEDGDLTEQIEISGRVNTNVVGSYPITYTVYDSDGNMATVTITIKVVLIDSQAPMIYGVSNKEIIVGENFNALAGVTSTDIVDGDLTSSIQVTGTVDVWKLGEYTLTYVSKDSTGNKAEATRKIVVSLGNFKFDDNSALPSEVSYIDGKLEATVSSGPVETDLSAFGLAKLTFTASSASSAKLALELDKSSSVGEVQLTATATEYTVYFRVVEEITEGKLSITGATDVVLEDVELVFGVATDNVAPTITIPTDYEVILPGDETDANALKPFILSGVEANDDIDLVVTSRLDVDFGSLVLGNLSTEEEVTIVATDKAGNKAEQKVKVQFVKSYNTGFIQDEDFSENENVDNWGLNGGSGNPTLKFENGTMIHNIPDGHGGWDSASSPFLRFQGGNFKAGNWYMLKFDAKATVARNMTVRIGLDTSEAEGWIENFKGASNFPTNLTTEMTTYRVIFYVHADKSAGSGASSVKLELKIGTFFWDGAKEMNNPVTIDNLQFFLLSNEDNAPELKIDKNLPTKFGKGATVDFKPYVYAYDVEDGGVIEILDSHIDLSGVNMNAAGKYNVVFKVKDSTNHEATITLPIEVLETADTTAPVIKEKDDLVKVVDQNSNPIDLLQCVTVTDNVDTLEEIKYVINGKVDVTKAGTYEVEYVVTDASGNTSELTITFTVNDKEAPKLTCSSAIEGVVKAKLGEELDLTKLVLVSDNVDKLTLTADNITVSDSTFIVDGNAAKIGEFTVTYTIKDAANNEATLTLTIKVEEVKEYIEGQTVINGLATNGGLVNGSDTSTDLTVSNENGVMKLVQNGAGAGWESSVKLKLNIATLEYDKVYKLKMELKADEAREILVNFGKQLSADPWFEYYTVLEGSNKFAITNEYATYEIIFHADKENATSASLEFRLGAPLQGAAANDEIFIKRFDIIEIISREDLLPDDATEIQITGNSKAENAPYTFNGNVVAVSDLSAGGSKWGRFNLSVTGNEFNKVVLVVKGEGLGIQFKIDDNDNKFDSVTGNKQTKTLNGYTTFEWNLDKLVNGTSKLTSDKIVKLVFWTYKNANGANTGSFEVVYLYAIHEELPPAQPSDAVDLAIGGVSTDGGAPYTFSNMNKTVKVSDIGLGASKWGRFNVSIANNNYHKLVLVVKGEGLKVTFKIDNTDNTFDTAAGNKTTKTLEGFTTYEWVISSITKKDDPNTVLAAKDIVKLVFWTHQLTDGANEGKFEIAQLYLVPSYEEPFKPEGVQDLAIKSVSTDANAPYAFSNENKTVTISDITKGSKWGRFNVAITGDDYVKLVIVVKGSGLKLQMKIDNEGNAFDSVSKQTKVLNQFTTFEWTFANVKKDNNTLAPSATVKIVFWTYQLENGPTTGSFEIAQMYLVGPKQEPTKPAGVVDITIGSTTVDPGAPYTFSNGSKTVTVTDISKGSKWGRFNFAITGNDYSKLVLVVKGTGFKLMCKVDDSSNGYDSVAGNKQTKELDQYTTFEWDLASLKKGDTPLSAQSIVKLVFWTYQLSNGVNTGAFEVVQLYLVPKTAEEPDNSEGPDYSNFDKLNWQPTLGYWYSKDSGDKAYTLNNSQNLYISSGVRFTKNDIPVGSIIVVKQGYQYRPEGWTTETTNASARPDETQVAVITVDEAWWGNYTYRAFNVSRNPKVALSEADYSEFAEAFIIYVPKAA